MTELPDFLSLAASRLLADAHNQQLLYEAQARLINDVVGWWNNTQAAFDTDPHDETLGAQVYSLGLVMESLQPLAELILGQSLEGN